MLIKSPDKHILTLLLRHLASINIPPSPSENWEQKHHPSSSVTTEEHRRRLSRSRRGRAKPGRTYSLGLVERSQGKEESRRHLNQPSQAPPEPTDEECSSSLLFCRFGANFWRLFWPTPVIPDQSKTTNMKHSLPSPCPGPPPSPPKVLKSHKSPIASTSTMKFIPEGMLVPLQVQLHPGKPMKTPPSAIVVKTIADNEKFTREDMQMVAAHMTFPDSRVQKKPFSLSSRARQPLSLPQVKLLS